MKKINYKRALNSTSGLIYVGVDNKAYVKNRDNSWAAEPKSKQLKKLYEFDKEAH